MTRPKIWIVSQMKLITILLTIVLAGCSADPPHTIEGEYYVRSQNVAYGPTTYVAIESVGGNQPFTLRLCGVHYEFWKGERVKLKVEETQDPNYSCWDVKFLQRVE